MKIVFTFRCVLVAAVVFGAAVNAATSAIFSNTNPIIINDSATPPTKASLYPSSIAVSGLTGQVGTVKVTVHNLSHSFPDDVNMMLVAPNGAKFVFWANAIGSGNLSPRTVTLDDAAATTLPNTGGLGTAQIYRPAAFSGSPVFPSPAPTPVLPADFAEGTGPATFFNHFNGIDPNGTWSLYVIDDNTGNTGSIADGWSLEVIIPTPPPTDGQVLISEFRLRGPGGGVVSSKNEFVELYNNTDSAMIVNTPDGSAGWALVGSDGIPRFIVPANTLIPARGHFLGVNSGGYPAWVPGDATYQADIPDDMGIALFRTANPANFVLSNRLDAAGPASETNVLYREGTGYPGSVLYDIDYCLYRDLTNGFPKDSGSNAADFLYVDVNGTATANGQRLGAPGPENLSSPVHLNSGPSVTRTLLDPLLGVGFPPNRARDLTGTFENPLGTVSFRRKFINNTGGSVTQLRFRVTNLSSFPSPNDVADLRLRTSYLAFVILSDGAMVTVQGSTLEEPPMQPNGGAFNSTVRVDAVSSFSPLPNGSSVHVQFLFGVHRAGPCWLTIVPETVPASASDVWILSAHTEALAATEATILPVIVQFERIFSDVQITFTNSPGRLYRLQHVFDLSSGTWSDTGPAIPGTGGILDVIDSGGGGFPQHFYRLRVVP